MKQNPVNLKLKKLRKMLEDGTLTWNESIQRGLKAWGPAQKSALIHSILEEYYIPSLCFARTIVHDEKAGKDVSYYSVLDGKQRLSVIFEFLDGEFRLHKTTPSITDDEGNEIVLAGKKFDELPKELQDAILVYQPSIVALEEYTAKELEIAFSRLNNGTPLTKVQQARPIMGGEVSGYINKVLEAPFFKRCNLTTLQRSREDGLTALLQGLMLIDDTYEWSGLGASEVAKYCAYLRDNFSVELQYKFVDTIKALGEVFDDDGMKYTFLKRINIPIVIKAASVYFSYEDVSPRDLEEFFHDFFGGEGKLKELHEKYETYCGEGSVNKEKVNGRVDTLVGAMTDYFRLAKKKKADNYLELFELALESKGNPKVITCMLDDMFE